MKKKILFISNPMTCGGIERALLSVLAVMDYSQYDVYFMPYIAGRFEWDRMVPSGVQWLEPPEYLRWHMMYREDVRAFIKSHLSQPGLVLSYAAALWTGKKAGFMDVGRQWFWIKNRKRYPVYESKFDVAVDFRGETGCYFMLDQIRAKKKIAWYHGDYKNYPRDRKADFYYWKRLDQLVVVDEKTKESLADVFPVLSEKIKVIHNLILKEYLTALAGDGSRNKNTDSFYLLQVGRLSQEKGFLLAVEVCRILFERGYQLEWHVVGEGPQRKELEEKIRKDGLEHVFILEGQADNPYPYYKAADAYVHTAYMEGKPITIDEAKLFCLPIVSTAFPTVKNQIADGVNGTVTDFEPVHIADAVERLITDRTLRERYREWLRTHPYDVSEDIHKLECLWEE